MKLTTGLALAALLVPAFAGAQGADSVLARIQRLGTDSSRALDYLQVLSDSIGPRLTGTRQQKNGNDWLVAQYGKVQRNGGGTGTLDGRRYNVVKIELPNGERRSVYLDITELWARSLESQPRP
jgi:hypothetical protein